MALKLRVISEQYQQLGKLGSRMFGVTGGRIGRSADNDWVLPDPDRYISSHHAAVRFQAGKWILEDVSTNGVFVNSSETPLSQHGPYALKDGDRIRMGDYDILVSLDDRMDFPMDSSLASSAAPPPKARAPRGKKDHDHDNLNAEIDINALLSNEATRFAPPPASATGRFEVGNAFGVEPAHRPAARAAAPIREAPDMNSASGMYENIPLAPPPSPAALPTPAVNAANSSASGEDWHLRTRRYQKSGPALVPGTAAAVKERGQPGDLHGELNAGIEAFCRGLGVDPSMLSNDLQTTTLTLAGQMLREVVLALMEALKSRGEFKGRFDPNQTGAQSAQNNPLKIGTSVDDAIRKLLDSQNTRYLGPVEALREVFGDLKTHQTAVTSGMQAGINGLMQRINPTELQDRFERNLKRAGASSGNSKGKYWELYAEFFQILNQRNNDGLPLSFHEDFVQTYIDRINGFRSSKRR